MYASNGTANSPIMIAGNWIRGGGPSQTSGGIMLGDSGGSYQVAENNILVNPGQYGISISGGHDLILRNNKAYSKKLPHSNVGMVIWDWWSWKQTGANPLYNITAENNELNWTNRDGIINTTYIHPNAGNVKGLSTNRHNPNLNESILPAVILNRAKRGGDNKPPVTPPVVTPPDSSNPNDAKFSTFLDIYNRVSIKCLTNPIQAAIVEIQIAAWGNTIRQNINGFRTLIDTILPEGVYNIKISYGNPVKTETSKIIVPGNNTPDDKTPEVTVPEVTVPENSGASKFSVSKDSYNRVTIKCLTNPIQAAVVEIQIPAWGNTIRQNINSLNNTINYALPAGKYDVKVSFGNPVKTETTKITID